MKIKNKRKFLDNLEFYLLGGSIIAASIFTGYNFFGKDSSKDKLSIKKNQVFLSEQYKSKLMGYNAIDLDNDGNYEFIAAKYDLNKDGKKDLLALYRVTRRKPNGNVMTKESAYALFIYKENKSVPDYILYDKDGNGTLESKVTLEEFKARENKKSKQLNKKKNFIYI